MSTIRYAVQGTGVAIENLNNLQRTIHDKSMKRIVTESMKPLLAEFQRTSKPPSVGVVRGRYSGSVLMRVKRFRRDRDFYSMVGTARGEAPHAHLIEAGTAERYTKAGEYRGVMPAMRPLERAYDASIETVMAVADATAAAEFSSWANGGG